MYKRQDEAIVAAVELSTRYITSRFLPDKAIDLVDEAASRLRLEMNSVPEEIDTLDRRVRQLEIEREAIRREKDRERVEQLTKEIEELKSRDCLLYTSQGRRRGQFLIPNFQIFAHISYLCGTMSDFIVSARKYRPATFASVVGQKHITSTLKNAIERAQLAHAYLFCGPRGVGKTTCACLLYTSIFSCSIRSLFS